MDIPRLLERLSINHRFCDNCGSMYYEDPDIGRLHCCAECASRTEYVISVGNDYTRHMYKYHNTIGVLENVSTNTVISRKVHTLRSAIKALEYAYKGETVQLM